MGVTFALSFNWPLKKTMDQESMTAFGFLYIIHFFRKNPNLSSRALSDTFMGKNIRFVPSNLNRIQKLTIPIRKGEKLYKFYLLTTTICLKQTSMNAKGTFTIATIPLERALTQRARLIVHVSLGLREME